MNHYQVKYFKTYESWTRDLPNNTPDLVRYYADRLTAAVNAAKRAVKEGNVFFALVFDTSGNCVFAINPAGHVDFRG